MEERPATCLTLLTPIPSLPIAGRPIFHDLPTLTVRTLHNFHRHRFSSLPSSENNASFLFQNQQIGNITHYWVPPFCFMNPSFIQFFVREQWEQWVEDLFVLLYFPQG